jgi:hypothetical protein
MSVTHGDKSSTDANWIAGVLFRMEWNKFSRCWLSSVEDRFSKAKQADRAE